VKKEKEKKEEKEKPGVGLAYARFFRYMNKINKML